MKKQLLLNRDKGVLYFARRLLRKTKSKQARYVRVWTKLGSTTVPISVTL